MIIGNDEIEEEEENKIKVNNDESKMITATFVKNNKKQVKTSNKKKHKIKVNERL